MFLKAMFSTVISAFALIGNTAFAADWKAMGETGQAAAYLDKASVRTVSGEKRVWIRYDLKYPDRVRDSGVQFLSMLQYMFFKCNEDTMKLVQVIAYSGTSGQGEVVDTRNAPPGIDFEPIPPGSIAETFEHEVCAAPSDQNQRTKAGAE